MSMSNLNEPTSGKEEDVGTVVTPSTHLSSLHIRQSSRNPHETVMEMVQTVEHMADTLREALAASEAFVKKADAYLETFGWVRPPADPDGNIERATAWYQEQRHTP